MSTCISMDGEYGEHADFSTDPHDDDSFVCGRCFAVTEDAMRERLAAATDENATLREQLAQAQHTLAAVEALADKMKSENGQSWNSVSGQRLYNALANPGPVLAKRDAQVLREAADAMEGDWRFCEYDGLSELGRFAP